MGMRRVWCAVVMVVGIATSTTGCAPEWSPAPQIAPSPTQPIPPTDEQLLAQSEDLVNEMARVMNGLGADPARDLDELLTVMTPGGAQDEKVEFERFRSENKRSAGGIAFRRVELVQRSPSGDFVELRACLDLSEARVVAPDGSDITGENRDNSIPKQIFIVGEGPSARVDSAETWEGSDPCGD